MRIMGIDFGTKRIGVAMSDELLLTAQGTNSIEVRGMRSDLESIGKLVAENSVAEIVVGLPLNMNGTHSQKTEETLRFVESLRSAVSVPVVTWDERLTSVAAERALLEADMSREKRKKLSDRLAAQFILQGYLDSKRRKSA